MHINDIVQACIVLHTPPICGSGMRGVAAWKRGDKDATLRGALSAAAQGAATGAAFAAAGTVACAGCAAGAATLGIVVGGPVVAVAGTVMGVAGTATVVYDVLSAARELVVAFWPQA
jgi:hypothetical protein